MYESSTEQSWKRTALVSWWVCAIQGVRLRAGERVVRGDGAQRGLRLARQVLVALRGALEALGHVRRERLGPGRFGVPTMRVG